MKETKAIKMGDFATSTGDKIRNENVIENNISI